jgi:hypothetical protein
MMRLRLVKLIIQPVLVADDGEYLTELQVQPITVMAAELPGWSGRFAAELAEREAGLDSSPGDTRPAKEV